MPGAGDRFLLRAGADQPVVVERFQLAFVGGAPSISIYIVIRFLLK
jgi:hypothetical protein